MSKEYDEYLESHIQAVKDAAKWMTDNLDTVKSLPEEEVSFFILNALAHDRSKYESTEYDPYDAYFYGTKDEDAFNLAWLNHIHNNPHHWQHWLLVNDDGNIGDLGKLMPLEMPKNFALEMIADWWSFSWRSGNLYEMFDWYDKNKSGIILHEKTREFVESVLSEIREALDNERLERGRASS